MWKQRRPKTCQQKWSETNPGLAVKRVDMKARW